MGRSFSRLVLFQTHGGQEHSANWDLVLGNAIKCLYNLYSGLSCGMDGVPAISKFTLLPNNLICMEGAFNVAILHQPLRILESNTKTCICGLNCKPATDIGKDKPATAEDMLNVNTCGYRIRVLSSL